MIKSKNKINGEFELIKKISKKIYSSKDKKPSLWKNVLKGIGDDAAVIKFPGPNNRLFVTTDMIVEDVHFSLLWSTADEIAMKLSESNISDIVAMAAIPRYAFLSMSIKPNTSQKFMNCFMKGLMRSFNKHNVLLLGGDTTKGEKYVFNLCLLGESKKGKFRSGAREKDLICVTGTLGDSMAGLNLLLEHKKNNSYTKLLHDRSKKSLLQRHLQPKSRTAQEGILIGKYATSMIDVSDGLASEIRHICDESSVGAIIYYDKIPISLKTKKIASMLNSNPVDYALYGGEDYQLIFTIDKDDINKLKKKFKNFKIIGEIVKKKIGCLLSKNGRLSKLHKGGFDHLT
ncbi:MAG: thiamine-phosphate kinase [Oligoflexia bacterium]|nr:thiamine-phosphate kinase [Oligoflexia bacterium]